MYNQIEIAYQHYNGEKTFDEMYFNGFTLLQDVDIKESVYLIEDEKAKFAIAENIIGIPHGLGGLSDVKNAQIRFLDTPSLTF